MNFKLLLTIIYLLFLTGSCGQRRGSSRIENANSNCQCGKLFSNNRRIVGGVEAEPNEFPWQVGLSTAGKFWFTCGGTLISSLYVVTAGHCFNNLDKQISSMKVVLGMHNFLQSTSHKQEKRIVDVKIHPNYKAPNPYDDIAIIRMLDPVVYTPYVAPICFPPPGNKYDGLMATVIGWGKTENGFPSPTLMKVQIPIKKDSVCYLKLGKFKPVPTQLCAYFDEGGKDACEGDSGSPMMIKDGTKWFFIGIVSHGWGCARPLSPGIYTRVDRYYKWIKDTVIDGTLCL